ncbi:MAG: sulfatase [Planctomycetes bacterium]|nr:sulfatase [Planctomycetota bacterium]
MKLQRPNILYFICHDIGRHMGCYGVPVETPNLDAFAAGSVRFANAFCNSAACTPSRVCAMTGQYAHVSGGVGLAHIGWPLAESERTIVDYLKDAGYETIHSGTEHERHPQANRYEVDIQEDWEDSNAEIAVNKALDCLTKRDRSRPFYLNIGTQQPHASSWSHADELYGGSVAPEDVYIPPYLPDRPGLRKGFGQFQAAIRYMDRHFGRLMDGLKRLGHDRDTIVVFTTDHGIAAPRSKSTLYDRGVEIALLIRLPDGSFAGTEVRHLIQNIDFVPTLLAAAGAPVPGHLPGKSFWPLLNGGPYTPHDHIFIERNFHGERRVWGNARDYVDRYDPVRAIRTPAFHYIRYFDPTVKCRPWLPFEIPPGAPGEEQEHWEFCIPQPREPRPEEELFHVAQDPQEFVNVAARPEFRQVKADLSRKLDEWMKSTDDFVLRGDVPKRYEQPGWGPNWPVRK